MKQTTVIVNNIPTCSYMNDLKKYDIALSFAGEDRAYVEKVAKRLLSNDISVFYDKFEEVELWGKNLYSHLNDIYLNKATYIVIFTSVNYAQNSWCNHELKSAQSKAFEGISDYILPAKFDDTVIDGVLPVVGFIDLRKKTPNEFAHLICEKLKLNTASLYSNMQKNKKDEIRELCCSRDFGRIHVLINKLSKYSNFTSHELNKLLEAAAYNKSISYIVLDDDIFDFYSNIISNNRGKINHDDLEKWKALIDKQKSLLV